jgi:hypothetical protein
MPHYIGWYDKKQRAIETYDSDQIIGRIRDCHIFFFAIPCGHEFWHVECGQRRA